MHEHQPTPLCGPVPDGLMRLTVDMPHELFDELRRAAERRELPVEHLLMAALCFAATTP